MSSENFFDFSNCWGDYFKPLDEWFDDGPLHDGNDREKFNMTDDKPSIIGYNWM